VHSPPPRSGQICSCRAGYGRIARIDLQLDREAELGGDHHRLVRAAGQDGLRHRDVERRQQRLAFHLGQHVAAFGQHAVDHQLRAVEAKTYLRRWRAASRRALSRTAWCSSSR
jgi:hypothetical protein